MSFVCKYVENLDEWHVGWDEWVADGEYKFTVVAKLDYTYEAAQLCNYLNGGSPHPQGENDSYPWEDLGAGVI